MSREDAAGNLSVVTSVLPAIVIIAHPSDRLNAVILLRHVCTISPLSSDNLHCARLLLTLKLREIEILFIASHGVVRAQSFHSKIFRHLLFHGSEATAGSPRSTRS